MSTTEQSGQPAVHEPERDGTSVRLYMDDGYLAFYPDPVELLVEGDSIDLDIRIREGKQYRIRNVIIKGNTKTNEHVVRREIRTKPGQLFNRSDVIRTQRELSQLGLLQPGDLGRESRSRTRAPARWTWNTPWRKSRATDWS